MTHSRCIELLAPAKNAEIGKEAILHGADAVYIGAPRFGARAAAGNSLDDLPGLSTLPTASTPASISPSTPCCTITS